MMNIANRSSRACRSRRIKNRTGLTALEYIGCAIAIAGGVWLGAMYAGVDLQQVAHTALDETEILEKVPAEWRPVGPADVETAEQKEAKLRSEFDSLGAEISSLHGNHNGSDVVSAAHPDQTGSGDATARDQTLSYWRAVNQIAFDEATMQKDAEAAFDTTNAAQVFAIKSRASQLAAKALAAVPGEPKVDVSAVKFTRQLGNWYENGAELYDRAVQIWESPTGAKSRVQLNEEWNRRELQHRNEARLISEKASALRSSLSRIYGVEFSGFVQPRGTDTQSPSEASQP